MKLSIGFIGLGCILDSHLKIVRAMTEYQIVGGCDLDAERRREFEIKTGARTYASYHDMLKEPPDVAVINLPHYLHAEATLACLANKCHVIVEKPMAISVAECNRMLQAAKQAGRRLIVAEAASFYPGPDRTGRKFKAGLLGGFLSGFMPCIRAYFNEHRPCWF
ncbi:MAG: Gfo/Idh/MocA family oxidoreductase, partial [Kiritimatiellia bacterium]|nr:Gfo/Idh/MocA family oxidoreductase [Kiritimatiellia bacterium]